MQNSTAEVLFDEQKSFFLQMKDIPGNKLQQFEVTNAPHNIFLGGQLLGFKKQSISATEKAHQFLKDQGVES